MTAEQLETMSRPELLAFATDAVGELRKSFDAMLAQCDAQRLLNADPAFHQQCDTFQADVESAKRKLDLILAVARTPVGD